MFLASLALLAHAQPNTITFADATSVAVAEAQAAATGDVTGDGLIDIIVVSDPLALDDAITVTVLPQLAEGGFAPAVDQVFWAPGIDTVDATMQVDDVNWDDVADVLIGTGAGAMVLVGDPGGLWLAADEPLGAVRAVSLVDLDGDGSLDVIAATDDDLHWWFYADWPHNPGSVHTEAGADVGLIGAQFSGDGDLDPIVRTPDAIRWFQGGWQGIDSYEETPWLADPGAPLRDMAVGDTNDDGWDDLLVSAGTTLQVLEYGGWWVGAGEVFPVSGPVGPVLVADIDGDGLGDLLGARDGAMSLWQQFEYGYDGEVDVGLPGTGLPGQDGLAVGDVSGDGCEDVVVLEPGEGVSILVNTTMTCPCNDPQLVGDANMDGQVDISDVVTIAGVVHGTITGGYHPILADADGDGSVGSNDFEVVLDTLFYGGEPLGTVCDHGLVVTASI